MIGKRLQHIVVRTGLCLSLSGCFTVTTAVISRTPTHQRGDVCFDDDKGDFDCVMCTGHMCQNPSTYDCCPGSC